MTLAVRLAVICAALVVGGCAAIPMSDAETACRSIFQAIRERSRECGLEVNIPDEDMCEDAYSYDREAMDTVCMPFLRSVPCETGMSSAEFRAHCAGAVAMKWW